MPLLADSSTPFAINGFAGLSGTQQLSFWLTFLLFNGYVVLEVVCLTSFWFAARPRHGRPNPAAVMYFIAALWVVLSFITMVWAAPAEKSFLDDGGHIGFGPHMWAVFVGLGFAGVAVVFLLTGMMTTASRRRLESASITI